MAKILIIDDEKPTLSMLGLLLEDAYGYDVLTAENGDQGFEIFKKERPGIVFTDIKMPGTDGLEVYQQLKAVDPNVRVIVMTGHGDRNLSEKAMALGVTAFIHKPIERQALEDALQKAAE
jgi:YesN/AraC family two-component response regulator